MKTRRKIETLGAKSITVNRRQRGEKLVDTKRINELHNHAMQHASQAFLARQREDYQTALSCFQAAFEYESQAAALVAETNIEPTRSVLHRSAATLALDCGKVQESERLIAIDKSHFPAPLLKPAIPKITFDRLSVFGDGFRWPMPSWPIPPPD